ncbi:cupin domain-containing protein [Psychrobacter sp. FDAARGOS_221]|uniref:cupin domain-containing protein n=1 Tax=Psychrobacter sp. FDAARGOS_221 TaxID=1975705 RepID=UPI000BB583C7|nr:cupin domain-containing protein [Psychrobacter sp. FDAARGOS_221]PNK61716.1 cupin domain-containing protein [Psychrobacter sp. FDAARGOS_221]
MTDVRYCLPDDMTAEQFLAEYWQKKPLLIKQGLPQLAEMFEPDDILGLSLEEAATARLITQNQAPGQTDQWQLQQSPLSEAMFDDLPEQWTVLVQNLEQWSPELGQLWNAFNFIPQWQRDDIMVSYAPAGGSVGKHYDDYDVFLAQGYGHRRWQLGKYCAETTEFIPDQPIRIFDDMGTLIFDEVLEPGDVLYVPPKLSHYGVAQDDCLTFSFGFRRPNLMQVLDSVVDMGTTDASLFVPLLLEQGVQSAGQLHKDSIDQIKAQLLAMLQSDKGDALIAQAVSEVVSKREYELLVPEDTLDLDQLQQVLEEGGIIRTDYSSRLIYTQLPESDTNAPVIYANGQRLDDISSAEAQLLKRLADGESLTMEDIDAESLPLETIMGWLENSWVWVDF